MQIGFFLSAIVCCLAVVSQASASPSNDNEEPPNIVLIMVDDLSDAVSGMGAVPTATTPNLQRLAESGVLFTNAHANSPVCAPSRNSMMSGLYPHTTGAYNFRTWSESDMLSRATSLFGYFKEHGYVTVGAGKLHHRRSEHTDDWSVIDGERQFAGLHDAGPWPWDGDPEDGRTIHPDQLFILDHVDDLENANRMKGSSSRFLSFGALSQVPSYPPNEENGFPGYTGWRNSDGSPFKWNDRDDRDKTSDELKGDFAVEAIKRQYDEPFFIAVGFNRPHEPLYVPDEYLDRFPIDEVELPPILANDWDDLDVVPETSRGYAFDRYKMYMRAGGRELVRRFVQHYLASAALIDDQVGKILDAIDEADLADNTIVVFVSDHGYHLGEKGAVYKATMWQEATRVPFVVRAPGVSSSGKTTHKPVSLVDIYPTLVDLAGLPPAPHANLDDRSLDGYSLRSLLIDPEAGNWEGPDYALSTIYGDENQSSEKWQDHNFTLVGERWKYIRYSSGGEELYDLDTDPEQWRNLAKEVAFSGRLEAMRTKLLQWVSAER